MLAWHRPVHQIHVLPHPSVAVGPSVNSALLTALLCFTYRPMNQQSSCSMLDSLTQSSCSILEQSCCSILQSSCSIPVEQLQQHTRLTPAEQLQHTRTELLQYTSRAVAAYSTHARIHTHQPLLFCYVTTLYKVD